MTKNIFKRNFTVQFTPKEWEMLEELEEKTNANSKASVIRRALLKMYLARDGKTDE